MTFEARDLPQVIVLGDGNALIGPFCRRCGNRSMDHRDTDLACPIRRMHPLLPRGEREVCTCTDEHKQVMGRHVVDDGFIPVRAHQHDCGIYKHGYTGSGTRTP